MLRSELEAVKDLVGRWEVNGVVIVPTSILHHELDLAFAEYQQEVHEPKQSKD